MLESGFNLRISSPGHSGEGLTRPPLNAPTSRQEGNCNASLILEDGTAIYDSPVICEYLDQRPGPALIPAAGTARWAALRRQGLADGILDAGVSILLESRRPESERSPAWVSRQSETIARALDAFEDEIDDLTPACTIGHVTLGCALGWLDFRLSDLNWRAGRTKLSAWEAVFATRLSMLATRPI